MDRYFGIKEGDLMNHNKTILCASALVLLYGLAACSGGGSSSDGSKPGPANLQGQVAHGVASDAIVRALRAGTGEELATTRTDADGNYPLTLDYTGPVLLTAETDASTILRCDSRLPEGCRTFP